MEKEKLFKENSIFDTIAIRDLSDEQKTDIAAHMINDVDTTLEYRSQMGLSAIIATLGLLINATPVVIGAMIIAPIMRPIQGVAFSISTGNKKLFFKAFKLLMLSILAGIGLAIIITRIIPLTEVTNEIASRTQPTLVDLGIAIASGAVGFLALGYKKMVEGLAGVAMAASLVPPLGVIGIGIAFGSFQIGWGSSVLFLTNLVAIIIAGILIFYSFGFYPNQKDDLKRSMKNTGFVFVMLLLLCIPLASSLIGITREISTRKSINKVTEDFFEQIDKGIVIENLTYESTARKDKSISLSLKVPQEQVENITDDSKKQLTEELSKKLNNNIALDVTLIPITSVTVKEAKEMSPEQKIRENVQHYLEVIYQDSITLLNTDYYTKNKRFAKLNLYIEDANVEKNKVRENLLNYIQDQEDLIDILLVEWQENYIENEPEEIDEIKNEELSRLSESFDAHFTQETRINSLDIFHQSLDSSQRPTLVIALNITSTMKTEALEEELKNRKFVVQELFSQKVEIEAIVEYLGKVSL